MEEILALLDVPAFRASVIVAGGIIAAKLVELIVRGFAHATVRHTKTDLDDRVVEAIRKPTFWTTLLVAIGYAASELPLTAGAESTVHAALVTLGILLWAGAGFRVVIMMLEAVSRRTGSSLVQPRTLPVFEMLVKIAVVGTTIYFLFLTWDIDLTAWLASAGIVGIAVGFAAKDTLANLFSGIFIVADAPYKIGDFIVLDGNLRGQVTKIGIRSTRILTRDDVEITVPNAIIGNSKIVNETGGPHVKQRIRIPVDVAYGSDIDLVRRVLLDCPLGITHVAPTPEPTVRFRELGASGLRFELMFWLEDPARRGSVVDKILCRIYAKFAASQIEIPYAKRDIYIKQMPGELAASPAAAPATTPAASSP